MVKYMHMNSSIWFFPIAALLNAVTSTILGVYIILTNYKKSLIRHLFIFCFSVAIWSYGYFAWQITDNAVSALFWCRFLMIGAIFTSILYFHLVLVYLNLNYQKFYHWLLVVFYTCCFFWVAISFTDLFVAGVVPISYFKFWPQPGPMYLLYLVFFATHFIYASVLLFKHYRKNKGDKRMQILLMGIGMLLGFIGGSTNYPLWYGINLAPWGNGLVTLYVILTVYAMMKYRFLDVKVVSTELFAGLLFLIFLIDVFLSKNLMEFIFRVIAVLIMGLFGIMLVRSVRQEIKRREEVTNLAHSLEQANLRLHALDQQKTEFLSIASHQLRTPLSITKGYIELIQDGAYGKISAKMNKILQDMDTSNERLIKLIDEFLDVTRIEQGRTKFVFEKKDLRAVVDGVVAEFHLKAEEKNMAIKVSVKAEKTSLMFDEEKIRHVVFNFVDNAIKYSETGLIKIELEEEGAGLSIRVHDNGIGFGKVDGANFFQKFYRGENVRGTNVNGTGLGLYVCRKFIEAHNGRVWAKSVGLEKGSEFGFWIPFALSVKK